MPHTAWTFIGRLARPADEYGTVIEIRSATWTAHEWPNGESIAGISRPQSIRGTHPRERGRRGLGVGILHGGRFVLLGGEDGDERRCACVGARGALFIRTPE